MVAADYVEAITYSFISQEQAEPFLAGTPVLRLLNPMASHQSVMRPSLLPGLLEATVANLNRKASRVRLFEIGRTYHDDPAQQAGDWAVGGIRQPLRLAGVAFGFAADESDKWKAVGIFSTTQQCSAYDFKIFGVGKAHH